MNNYSNITILICSYEPNEALVTLCKELKEKTFDIVVVNDGSKEKFDEIFNKAKEHSEVLSYKKNHGKGYAIRYGISYILSNRKEQVGFITVDGDGQHLIKDIIKVADKMLETNHIVFGIRKFKEDVPFRSKFGNMWSRFTQTLTTDKYIEDNQCGLRAFPLSVGEHLLTIPGNRYEYEMNVISSLFMKDFPYEEVDIEAVYEKGNPTSHFSPFIDTCRIQGMILLYGFAFFIILAIQMIGTGLLLYLFSFLNLGIPKIVEFLISFAASSYVGLVVGAGLNTLVYRPRRPYYHIVRTLYLVLAEMIFIIPITFVFSYVLSLHYILSFIIALLIALFPMFFILKGINYLMKKK